MGLTTWAKAPNGRILKSDVVVAKNYLTEREMASLSLIGDNLSTDSTKTTIELNLAVLKITHEVTRMKARDSSTVSGK